MNDELKYYDPEDLKKIKPLILSVQLPDNPTNGDVLQAVFAGISAEECDYAPLISTNLDGSLVSFLPKWWNAPYTGKGGPV